MTWSIYFIKIEEEEERAWPLSCTSLREKEKACWREKKRHGTLLHLISVWEKIEKMWLFNSKRLYFRSIDYWSLSVRKCKCMQKTIYSISYLAVAIWRPLRPSISSGSREEKDHSLGVKEDHQARKWRKHDSEEAAWRKKDMPMKKEAKLAKRSVNINRLAQKKKNWRKWKKKRRERRRSGEETLKSARRNDYHRRKLKAEGVPRRPSEKYEREEREMKASINAISISVMYKSCLVEMKYLLREILWSSMKWLSLENVVFHLYMKLNMIYVNIWYILLMWKKCQRNG